MSGRGRMKIKWYGHACFRIEGSGISIVTDPYTPEVAGLNPVEEPGDVVDMSGYRAALGPHSYRRFGTLSGHVDWFVEYNKQNPTRFERSLPRVRALWEK